MNKLLTAMTAACAIAAAAPALAQSSQADIDARGAVGIQNRIDQLDARIDAGIRAGLIDRTEARSLRRELRQLTRLEAQYSRNGLSREERADLRARIRDLRQDIRLADGGRFDRDDRYGNLDDDDDYYGRGGPYEPLDEIEACESRGGIGGIFERVFGVDDCPGLRVGQRVSGSLYAVPSEYRAQFRDGGGVYYRSDGRAIYQIDARTRTVLRVYAMER